MTRRTGIQSSPFLPSLPPIAIGVLGRVVNPGTLDPEGLIGTAARLDHTERPILGHTSYTRQATPNRAGGIFPPDPVRDGSQARVLAVPMRRR